MKLSILMPVALYRSLDIRSRGFGMEAEITGKLLRRGIRPYEVPVSYRARGRDQGKKITWTDGVEAPWILGRERARRAPTLSQPGGEPRGERLGRHVGDLLAELRHEVRPAVNDLPRGVRADLRPGDHPHLTVDQQQDRVRLRRLGQHPDVVRRHRAHSPFTARLPDRQTQQYAHRVSRGD